MIDDAQRAKLLAAKLKALIAPEVPGDAPREDRPYPGGAAVAVDGGLWVLLDTEPVTALGAALVWADRQRAGDVNLVAELEHAGVLARRAACFDPEPRVWAVEGVAIAPARAAAPAVPEPALASPALTELLELAGLEIVVEAGVVRGEILGLEVARIAHGTSTSGEPIDGPLLEVGVGRADRELTGMLHGNLDPVDQLARVSEIVRRARRVGAEPHPLNQLVPERWLRARLVAEPGVIGLAELRSVPAAIPRPNLRDKGVAVAVGSRPDGEPVVVVCSVGIDLDLVPAAADARLSHAPDADLVVVLPERDAHPVTRALAARLARPAELIALAGDWRGAPTP